MRLFCFLILATTSLSTWAQDCHTTDLPTGGNFNCPGIMYIDSPLVRINPDPFTILPPLEITASDIVIGANITLDGGNGLTIGTANADGGVGGPGASPGGGIISGTPAPGGFDSQDGGVGVNDSAASCGSGGGGGGGANSAGVQGSQCASGTLPGGTAGTIASFALVGYGGGSGGERVFGAGFDLGAGGGGGGSIRLTATTGTIKISNGVRISARGGRGGNSVAEGGAGGGGGGGVIHLLSPNPIENNGIFDVRGGDGGRAPRGGHGGRGGNGIFRFTINGVDTDGTGLQIFGSQSFKSDISCGTIGKPNEKQAQSQSLFFNMILGFALVMVVTELGKNFKNKKIRIFS